MVERPELLEDAPGLIDGMEVEFLFAQSVDRYAKPSAKLVPAAHLYLYDLFTEVGIHRVRRRRDRTVVVHRLGQRFFDLQQPVHRSVADFRIGAQVAHPGGPHVAGGPLQTGELGLVIHSNQLAALVTDPWVA